ncbi:hypothetical protein ACIQNU_26665 [Streptomyces sp. NPDC091292]|uniref:SCO4402 family protein n=1 Tax=Streptomyces sp. NPDC091292 TaxID=3365991 RepID=UPI00382969E5
MEQPEVVIEGVEFPEARPRIAAALRSLSDVSYQQRAWVRRTPAADDPPGDLTTAINVLYDDHHVLDDPEAAWGPVLRNDTEVAAMKRLADLLNSLIEEKGWAGDEEYVAAPAWTSVAEAADAALREMCRPQAG